MFRVENKIKLFYNDILIDLCRFIPLDYELDDILIYKNSNSFCIVRLFIGNRNDLIGVQESFVCIIYKNKRIVELSMNFFNLKHKCSEDGYLNISTKGRNALSELTCCLPTKMITVSEDQELNKDKRMKYNVLFYKLKRCCVIPNFKKPFKIISKEKDGLCVLKRQEKIKDQPNCFYFYKGKLIYNIKNALNHYQSPFIRVFKPMGLELIVEDYKFIKKKVPFLISDEMIVKILLQFLEPKKICKLMLRNKTWTPKTHCDFVQEFREFVHFLMWLNDQNGNCFTKISFDVLVYKIIPFISERSVVLTKYERVVNGFLLLKGFKLTRIDYETESCLQNLQISHPQFVFNIEKHLIELYNRCISSSESSEFMIALKILNKVNKKGEIGIEIVEWCLSFISLLFVKLNIKNENDIILTSCYNRILKNSIKVITKSNFLNNYFLGGEYFVDLVEKLCLLVLRIKGKSEKLDLKVDVLRFYVKIVESDYSEHQEVNNEIIKNLILFMNEQSENMSVFLMSMIMDVVKKMFESKVVINEKILFEFIRNAGKFEDFIVNGDVVEIFEKGIDLEKIFDKIEYYSSLLRVLRSSFRIDRLESSSVFGCVDIVASNFDYTNPNDYLTSELYTREIKVLTNIVFFIKLKDSKGVDNQTTEINKSLLFEELEKFKQRNISFFNQDYYKFFNHCIFLFEECYKEELLEYEKDIKNEETTKKSPFESFSFSFEKERSAFEFVNKKESTLSASENESDFESLDNKEFTPLTNNENEKVFYF